MLYFSYFGVKWYIAIIGILIIGYIHFFQSKANFKKTNNTIKINKKYLFLVLFIILIWCILGGQGNLYYQSSDWGCRNAIYKKMILEQHRIILKMVRFCLITLGIG